MASNPELTQPLRSTTPTESQQSQPPPRKSPRKPPPPNLGITPPNPASLLSTPNPSGSATPAATPPVPLKSPLRSISGGSSVTSYNSYSSVEIPGEISVETGIGLGFEGKLGLEVEGKVEKVRRVKKLASMDSIIANAGTPLTSQTRMTRLVSATADDHTSQSPSQKDVNALKKPDDARFTMLTAPSIYSQDSAPSSATSSAGLTDSPTESTSTAGKAGSGNASESTKGSGRRRPMSGVFTQMAVGWGKMKEEREKRKSVDLGNSGHRVCATFLFGRSLT